MGYTDLHTHTCFCDGKNTPEEMVLSALEKGLDCIGICTHSYTFFDERYCISKDRIADFQQEIRQLKKKYVNRIHILCGVEQDFFSTESTSGFDYVIGSVHYLQVENGFVAIDESPEVLSEGCKKYFDGNYYALAGEYYKTVAHIVEKTNCDIIGHFDLITKFNEKLSLFDTYDPRHVQAWQSAVDSLIPFGKPFEINTGAISRGWRTSPYPSREICDYLLSRGGKLILSGGDAHSAETIAYEFGKWENMAHALLP